MVCYNCGNNMEEGAAICEKCGAPAGAFAPPPSPPQAPAGREEAAYAPQPAEQAIAEQKKGRLFSILALIAGGVSFLIGCIPFLPLVLEAAGIVLAVIGLKKDDKKTMGVSALVLSIVALVSTLLVTIFSVVLLLNKELWY